jgi:transposase
MEKQWEIISPLLPELPRRADGRGKPWTDNRALLNGMLWFLRTAAPRRDLPPRYRIKSTVHRRFQQWVGNGVFEEILAVLAGDVQERGKTQNGSKLRRFRRILVRHETSSKSTAASCAWAAFASFCASPHLWDSF